MMIRLNPTWTVLLITLVALLIASDSLFARGRSGGRAANRATGVTRGSTSRPAGSIGGPAAATGRNFSPPPAALPGHAGNFPRSSWPSSAGRPQTAQQVQSFLGGRSLDEQRPNGQAVNPNQGNLSQPPGELSQLNQNAQQLRSRAEGWNAAAENFDGSNLQSAVDQWHSGPQPFSPAWYAEHPNAWQATHPYANEAAVVATAATVAAWTAQAAQPSASSTTTIVESGDTIVYEAPPEQQNPTPAPPPDAANQAWLALGTYAVAPQVGAPPSRVMQLAVNRQGQIGGVYFDQLTGGTQNLTGTLNQAANQATWHAEGNPAVVFTTSLESLTSDTGKVQVRQAGRENTWWLKRQD